MAWAPRGRRTRDGGWRTAGAGGPHPSPGRPGAVQGSPDPAQREGPASAPGAAGHRVAPQLAADRDGGLGVPTLRLRRFRPVALAERGPVHPRLEGLLVAPAG